MKEKYVKTDASIHVHWFRKIEDKGSCFFFSLSNREQKTDF